MINGNGKEVFKKLYEYHKTYLEYQQKLINKYGSFYCIECNEIHPISERARGNHMCIEQYRKINREQMRRARARKKAEQQTLAK
ncbi:hypothetical protein [Clostridium paraputrificum]|uniref:hypothetical protein n=1 Tax=Clostridium paraputrificum TaxID=29363 RepID=UPI003F63E7E3